MIWREEAPEPPEPGMFVLCGIMRWIGTRGCDGGRPPGGCISRLGTPCACSALRCRAIWLIWPCDILRRGEGEDTAERGLGRASRQACAACFEQGLAHPNMCDM